jgi:hypothetical protein
MNISRKAVFSLLISTLLFAVFAALAFTGLFDLVEARFYNPAVARAIGREIDADTQVIDEFFEELQIRFAATLNEGAVRRSLLSDLESEDIALRASLYGELLGSLGGLQSVRFIDSGGRRIHFSTWPPDILRQDRNSIAYRNYGAEENSAAYIPYGQVEALAPRLILDGAGERIIFSYPFYDSFDVYRGTALFSLSVRAVMDRMVSAGQLKVGEAVSVISEPPGLAAGLPAVGQNVLLPLIARMWSENSLSLGRINSDLTGANLALISRKTDQNIYVGRLINASLLTFPLAMRIILLISFFITVYLIIFLLFNFRQDDLTIIQSRLKKLQINLLEEYYEQAGDLNWSRWRRELEHRREDVHSELKRGLNIKAEGLAEVDNFIDQSWDDLMAIIGGQLGRQTGIDDDTLRTLLGRLLPESTNTAPLKALDKAEPKEPEEVEALNEADIVEALEGPPEKKMASTAPEPDFEELEFEELELAELDIEEPEELEAVDDPDAPKDPAGAEAAGPELAEPEELEAVDDPDPPEAPAGAGTEALEAADGPETPQDPTEAGTAAPGLADPEDGEPWAEAPEAVLLELGAVEFQGIAPLEFEGTNAPETAIDNLVRAIEFSPESQEVEQEKEQAAKSMAEHFNIQSPFTSIFSTLSELEFEAEPMEDLEPLEKEWLEPDESLETEAEELRFSFAGPQLSVPFQKELNSEITLLPAEDNDEDAPGEPEEEAETGAVITERDGVSYINESVLSPDKETLKGLDKNFKNLIDSIINSA